MMASLTNSSQILVQVLIVASLIFADAFRSSATATHPVVSPFSLPMEGKKGLNPTKPTEKLDESEAFRGKLTQSRRKVKYDLGLGKHEPVTNKKARETTAAHTDFCPTRFLVEHESVRMYPSPLSSDSESLRQNTNGGLQQKKKNLPKVQHRRHSEDVLHIRDPRCIEDATKDYNYDNLSHPIIAQITQFSAESNVPATKLDVNTIWVEMMIHNEGKKFLAN